MDSFNEQIQCEELISQVFGLAAALIPQDELEEIFAELKNLN
jgi:hypothetical protein